MLKRYDKSDFSGARRIEIFPVQSPSHLPGASALAGGTPFCFVPRKPETMFGPCSGLRTAVSEGCDCFEQCDKWDGVAF